MSKKLGDTVGLHTRCKVIADRFAEAFGRQPFQRTEGAGVWWERRAKEMARVRRLWPFFATRATNTNQRSSIATGWLPTISIRTFPWNRFSAA